MHNLARIRALLDAQADVDAADRLGNTPLSAALQRAAWQTYNRAAVATVAGVLLQAGAAVTASVLAAAANLLALQQQQPQQQAQQPAAALQEIADIWRALLAAASSVDVRDSKGRTALNIAVT